MSIRPLITFKAGICEFDESAKPWKVKSNEEKGFVSLYVDEDDMLHFSWRPRAAQLTESDPDLIMFPGDATFTPYQPKADAPKPNGRIFVLKFGSSGAHHFFWLQSKPQGSTDPNQFSPRDTKIGEVVNKILQEGPDEVNVDEELANAPNTDDSRRDGDDDETMEDIEGHGEGHHGGGTGGAGMDATGGDPRQEGEGSREGGADGARAAASGTTDANELVRNLLNSLGGSQGQQSSQQQQQGGDKLYPMLSDLLEPPVTIPMIDAAPVDYLDNLLSYLPPTVLVLSQQGDNGDPVMAEPSAESVEAAKQAMSHEQKRALLKKVLRSPQFSQSLVSLTIALRDGGLPTVAQSLQIPVANGGLMHGSSMPLGGGNAVEAFVEGIKKSVTEEKK